VIFISSAHALLRFMATQDHSCCVCSGTGTLPHYSHVADGMCFACQGSGSIADIKAFNGPNSEVCLQVLTQGNSFWYAVLACRTWRDEVDADGTVWHLHGRDRWSHVISDADEARRIWRHAKRLGVRTDLCSH
jgi:hypothetical protein